MKVRSFLQSSVLALMVATAGFVSAQESDCLNLSADDCAYLNTAIANGAAALGSSFQYDFTIDATVSGIPESEDAEFHVVGTGPVIANAGAEVPLNFGATMDVNYTDGTNPGSATLEVRLVDDIIYVKNPEDGKWVGTSAVDALESFQSQMESNPMMPAAGGMDLSSLGLDEEDLTAIMALPEAEGFLDFSRSGETFTFTADVGSLLGSEEWTAFTTQITPKLQQNPDMAQVAGMLPLLPMILPEAKIQVVQVVDPSVNAVTEMSILIDGQLNGSMMGGGEEPIDLSFAFNVKVSNIGAELTVEAPADAEIQEMPAGS
jgi:hypothetical protein